MTRSPASAMTSSGAEGEAEAQRDAEGAGVVARAQCGDGAQHWPGAGDEDQTEPEAEDETRGARRGRGARETSEGSFEETLHPGHHQAHAEEHQQGDTHVAQQVLRQPQAAQEDRTQGGDGAEAENQSRDHGHRAAPTGAQGVLFVGHGSGPTDEDHGQDGQDAG